jgi:UDP-2,3-diacylglucosamine pyrophosphatase LpxH
MKIGIISDTHIGDDTSTIIEKDKTGRYQTSQKFEDLKTEIFKHTQDKPLDYLILNGDILDFAINSFYGACPKARVFFQEIYNVSLTNHIIFLPGNHDKHIWDGLEWQCRVMKKMEKYEDPEKFIGKQTGILDLVEGKFILDKIHDTDRDVFIKGLFKNKSESIPISIVHPNLYIKTKKEVILVTHGHMLDLAWTIISEIVAGLKVIPGEMEFPEATKIKDYETYNIPITSMLCTASGQAGDITKLINKIEHYLYNINTKDVQYEKNLRSLKHIVETLWEGINKVFNISGLVSIFSFIAKRKILMMCKDYKKTRYNEDYFKDKEVKERFLKFYNASCVEAEHHKLSPPTKVFFGHTHDVMGTDEKTDPPMKTQNLERLGGIPALLYNTGGWLKNDDRYNAAVFIIDTDGGIDGREIEI